jgi:hypothetical protein
MDKIVLGKDGRDQQIEHYKQVGSTLAFLLIMVSLTYYFSVHPQHGKSGNSNFVLQLYALVLKSRTHKL